MFAKLINLSLVGLVLKRLASVSHTAVTTCTGNNLYMTTSFCMKNLNELN